MKLHFIVKLVILLLGTSVGSKLVWSQNIPTVSGFVFLDENGNGLMEAGEPGIMDVRVNDSYTWTKTDETGFYTLPTRTEYIIVRLVIPSAFWPTTGGNGWFYGIDFTQQETAQVDFALKPRDWPSQVKWFHIADTHVWYAWDDSMDRDELRAAFQDAADANPAFVVVNGDTHYTGTAGMPEKYRRLVAPLIDKGIPVFTIPGDSERASTPNSACPGNKQRYSSAGYCLFMQEIGPLVFSHDVAGYHLIFVQTNTGASDWEYGDSWQLKWLEQDLSFVPQGQPLVFFFDESILMDCGGLEEGLLYVTPYFASHNVVAVYAGNVHKFCEDIWDAGISGSVPVQTYPAREFVELTLDRRDEFYGPEQVGLPTSVHTDFLAPNRFKLEQNYPNPFNPYTSIRYWLKEPSFTEIIIYDIKGRIVKTLVNDVISTGDHNVVWDGRNDNGKSIVSGIYFYTIRVENSETTRKMLLLK